jgi:hypothetical protein
MKKKAPEIDRTALRKILKLRRCGGSREDALALAKLLFRQKDEQLPRPH